MNELLDEVFNQKVVKKNQITPFLILGPIAIFTCIMMIIWGFLIEHSFGAGLFAFVASITLPVIITGLFIERKIVAKNPHRIRTINLIETLVMILLILLYSIV